VIRVKTGLLSAVCAIGVFLLVLVGTVLYVFSQGKPECDGVCLESWNAGWAPVISALCGLPRAPSHGVSRETGRGPHSGPTASSAPFVERLETARNATKAVRPRWLRSLGGLSERRKPSCAAAS
jgi:hypothetical protein